MWTAMSSCGQLMISGLVLLAWLMTASCKPRKLDAQFIDRYSMSSVLKTSTMKSPPLVVWLTGSLTGGWVSSAIWRDAGAADLFGFGAAGSASAVVGAAIAAALASVAPLRKLRRAMSDEWFLELPARFDMSLSTGVRRCGWRASTRVLISLKSCPPAPRPSRSPGRRGGALAGSIANFTVLR